MSRNGLWKQLTAAFTEREEVISPEASGDAKYSYRNYRCDENVHRSPRADERSYTGEQSIAGPGSQSPQVEYCRV